MSNEKKSPLADKDRSDYLDYIQQVSHISDNSKPEPYVRPADRDPSNLQFIMPDDKTIAIKIALLGDGAVGKTSLRKSYLGEGFSSEYLLTLGADFAMKTVHLDGKTIKFQIWDLSGQLRFSQVRKGYYAGCYGGILVFDRTRPESLEHTMHWLNELWKNSGKGPIPFLILGNKSDLVDGNIKIDKKASLWAKTFSEETLPLKGFDVQYVQTSAKTGLNVDFAFDQLARNIFSWIDKVDSEEKEKK